MKFIITIILSLSLINCASLNDFYYENKPKAQALCKDMMPKASEETHKIYGLCLAEATQTAAEIRTGNWQQAEVLIWGTLFGLGVLAGFIQSVNSTNGQ